MPRPGRAAPGQAEELIALWWSEAGKYNALPLESRTALEILTTERPQLSKPRDQYTYYPGCEEVPESVAVNIRNRSYSISADVTIDSAKAGGVLFAHGCRFGGHALYVKDGKLKYDYNYVGEIDQYVESTRPIPAGDCRLSASFEKSGTGMPTEGVLSLYINKEKVGEGKIKTQPGKFSWRAKGSTSAWTGASRSPATTPATRRGRSPAGRSTRSSSTSPVTRGSTAKRKSRPRSHATDNQERGARAAPVPRRRNRGRW